MLDPRDVLGHDALRSQPAGPRQQTNDQGGRRSSPDLGRWAVVECAVARVGAPFVTPQTITLTEATRHLVWRVAAAVLFAWRLDVLAKERQTVEEGHSGNDGIQSLPSLPVQRNKDTVSWSPTLTGVAPVPSY